MKLYFVTGNEKKAEEAKAIVPEIERISLDLPEIQSLDPKEVINAKLDEAHAQMPDKYLAVEDVAYSIAGLNGLPGTLIKWFIETVGPKGIYAMVKDKDCTTSVTANLGLITPEGEKIFVVGEIKGTTVSSEEGEGFYFDSIFVADGYKKRYSEMAIEQKNKISHRALAWKKLNAEIAKLTN